MDVGTKLQIYEGPFEGDTPRSSLVVLSIDGINGVWRLMKWKCHPEIFAKIR